jgi:hypothetical protein
MNPFAVFLPRGILSEAGLGSGTCSTFPRPTGSCQLRPVPPIIAVAGLEASLARVAKLLQKNVLDFPCLIIRRGIYATRRSMCMCLATKAYQSHDPRLVQQI